MEEYKLKVKRSGKIFGRRWLKTTADNEVCYGPQDTLVEMQISDSKLDVEKGDILLVKVDIESKATAEDKLKEKRRKRKTLLVIGAVLAVLGMAFVITTMDKNQYTPIPIPVGTTEFPVYFVDNTEWDFRGVGKLREIVVGTVHVEEANNTVTFTRWMESTNDLPSSLSIRYFGNVDQAEEIGCIYLFDGYEPIRYSYTKDGRTVMNLQRRSDWDKYYIYLNPLEEVNGEKVTYLGFIDNQLAFSTEKGNIYVDDLEEGLNIQGRVYRIMATGYAGKLILKLPKEN